MDKLPVRLGPFNQSFLVFYLYETFGHGCRVAKAVEVCLVRDTYIIEKLRVSAGYVNGEACRCFVRNVQFERRDSFFRRRGDEFAYRVRSDFSVRPYAEQEQGILAFRLDGPEVLGLHCFIAFVDIFIVDFCPVVHD